MMKSTLSAAVAALVVCGGLVATSPTATAGPAPAESAPSAARTVVPMAGHYSGHDLYGRPIHFNYWHGRMDHFRIEHHSIGGAAVLGARWSTSCTDAYYCSWGEWETSQRVKGGWNHGTHGGTARSFTAHWVSSAPG
jgi:hypothetical protein